MKKIARALLALAAVIGLTVEVVGATVTLAPPDNGRRNSVTYNGRTYSSTPGVGIPVPDFDATILQANGWTIATSPATESPFAALRRIARKPSINSSTVLAPLVGARPWAATTAFTTGAVVSKGGLAYIAATGGTTGAAWTNTRGIGQTDGSVIWDYIGPQTAPQLVNVDATTHDAALTNILLPASIATLPAGQGPLRWRGGPITERTQPGYFATTAVTRAAGTGFFTSTRDQSITSIEFICECTKVEFGVLQGARPYNIIVDGRNLDWSPVLTSGTPTASSKYFTLDFTNVQATADIAAGAGRARRHVVFEYSIGAALAQLSTEPTATISYPPYSEEWSIGIIGDSQALGSIQGTFTNSASAWPQQLAKILDIPDICNASTGGTGFVTAGPAVPFGGHALTDLALCNAYRPIKYIIVLGSTNDNGQPASALTSAAASLFTSIRAAYPAVPIFVTGVIQGGGVTPATAQATENAVFAGATGISSIYTIPVSTASPAWFSGNGREGAANGTGNNDFNSLADGIHLSQSGQAYMARRVAAAILSIAGKNP